MKPAKIPVHGKNSNGKTMLVDVDDVEVVARHRWHVTWNGYATNRSKVNGKQVNIRAHHLVVTPPEGMDVDHINGNRLDNRRSNLRVCTRAENLLNRPNLNGTWLDKRRGTWQVTVTINDQKHYFGAFKEKEEATHMFHSIRELLLEGGKVTGDQYKTRSKVNG